MTVSGKRLMADGLSMLVLAMSLLISVPVFAGPILDQVRSNGFLRCGVVDLGVGLSTVDDKGEWTGFYADICRAVAAAVTGDKANVEFKPLSTEDRFNALRDGVVDMLSEASSWTLSRDWDGLTFPTIYLYDSQGFLARRADGIAAIDGLRGKPVCVHGVQGSTVSMSNLRTLDMEQDLKLQIKGFQTIDGAFAAFFDGQCSAVTGDVMILVAMKEKLAPDPDGLMILDERISKQVLGPVIRQGDEQWADIVRWVIFSMIAAEELGMDSGNVVAMRESTREDIQRILGVTGNVGRYLDLDREWIFRVIRQIGNYGEVHDRHLVRMLKMERGPNAPWTQGGLLWAPSIR